jgi:hypothetical protein
MRASLKSFLASDTLFSEPTEFVSKTRRARHLTGPKLEWYFNTIKEHVFTD